MINNNFPVTEITKKLELFKKEYENITSKQTKKLLTKMEKEEILNSVNEEDINKDITLEELTYVIKNAKNGKAYGPDKITYEFYKNAPEKILEIILKNFNRYWVKGEYPNEIKKAIINPILKPGKDPTKINSYRFISRTPCIGKLFENIITRRINWWLEKNNLDEDLIGFRPDRNTTDALQIIEMKIRQAIKEKKNMY